MSDDPVTTITLGTSDGQQLEAEVSAPPEARVAVVITHPHPAYGGSMHTPVPAALFKTARDLGLAALRFNFRGVGASTGHHDEGGAERLDVTAAVDHVADLVPTRPIVLTGWSFGADVTLAVDHDRLHGWLPVAAPLGVVPPEDMIASTSPKPKHLLVPEHDQFRSPTAAAAATAAWPATTLETVPGTDHFLAGGLGVVGAALRAFVAEL